jgi:hypothetical protein
VKEKLRRSIERLRRGRGGDYVFRKETSHVAEAGSDAAAMSAMEVLNNEITALRRVGFPCGVQMVTDPVPARYVTVPGGTKHEANAGVVPNPDRGTGPFHVHSWILGERGSGYHKAPTHFRFSFSSLYPREPPDVHVLSVCHHALIDDDKEVSSLFYHPANLPPKRAGSAKEDLANEKSATDADVSPSTPDKVEFVEYDLQGILVAAHAFMSKPLRIPNDIGHQQKGLDEVWRNAASMNEKRDEGTYFHSPHSASLIAHMRLTLSFVSCQSSTRTSWATREGGRRTDGCSRKPAGQHNSSTPSYVRCLMRLKKTKHKWSPSRCRRRLNSKVFPSSAKKPPGFTVSPCSRLRRVVS